MTYEPASSERFSLLLLEPSEIYFDDFSVFYYPDITKSEQESIQRRQKGRLKVCSKSLVFDPIDNKYPLLKFFYNECTEIGKREGHLFSKINGIVVKSTQVIEMLEGNFLAPYKFKNNTRSYLFSPNFKSLDECLPNIMQLKRASTLNKADQSSMIATIVCSIHNRKKFDLSWLDSTYEKYVLEIQASRITPLVTNPGRVYLTDSRLYFQPYNNVEKWPILKLKLSDIKRAIPRRFLLRQVGLELYCRENALLQHLFITFKNYTDRDHLYKCLLDQDQLTLDKTDRDNMTLLWQNRRVSNYEYLLYLNSCADRSFNDLTQYPVFPWVLTDYTSSEIDLDDKSIYRDLKKPIGALDPVRLTRLKERYLEMIEMGEPPFLYGSHYSTPGFVLYYLVRKLPQFMLCLQGGRFDNPDRMFNSIPCTWKNVINNTSDFKELIPEFYDIEGKGDFLTNMKNLNFGIRSDNNRVGDVELPPWAKSPEDFVKKMHQALESEYVSENLHHWIDLMFGYKNQGREAIKADNVFHPATYEGEVDLDSIPDLNDRYAKEVQIMEYGQTPCLIFSHPHPQRGEAAIPVNINPEPSEIDSLAESIARKISFHYWSGEMTKLQILTEYKLHKDKVTDISFSSDQRSVITVSMDCFLKVYSLDTKSQTRSVNICRMALSSCQIVDNKTIFVGAWDNSVYIYDLTYGREYEVSPSHDDAISKMRWNDNLLVTVSWDANANLWEYTNKRLVLKAVLDHDSSIHCVDISPDNEIIVTGTSNGTIYFWRNNQHLSIPTSEQYSAHTQRVRAVCFSLDGQKVASCGDDKMIKVIDVKTGTSIFYKETKENLLCLCWDGMTLLAGDSAGRIQIWNMVQGTLSHVISAHKKPVTCLEVSTNGDLIASGSESGEVKIWKT